MSVHMEEQTSASNPILMHSHQGNKLYVWAQNWVCDEFDQNTNVNEEFAKNSELDDHLPSGCQTEKWTTLCTKRIVWEIPRDPSRIDSHSELQYWSANVAYSGDEEFLAEC